MLGELLTSSTPQKEFKQFGGPRGRLEEVGLAFVIQYSPAAPPGRLSMPSLPPRDSAGCFVLATPHTKHSPKSTQPSCLS